MPRKPLNQARPKLAPVSFRTSEYMKGQLETRARARSRSLSEEIEDMLNSVIDFEERLGDRALMSAMRFIGEAAGQTLKELERPLTDPAVRARVTRSIVAATNLYLPSAALWEANPELAKALDEIAVSLQMTIPGFVPSTVYVLVDGRPLSEPELEQLRAGIEALRKLHVSNLSKDQLGARVDWFHAKLSEAQDVAVRAQRSMLDPTAGFSAERRDTLNKLDRWNAGMAAAILSTPPGQVSPAHIPSAGRSKRTKQRTKKVPSRRSQR